MSLPRASLTRDAEFSAFVRTGRADLLRSAYLLTAGDAHLAEDLVQVALVRLYLAWPRVRADTGPGGYARRILVNAFLDERRRPFRRREHSTAEPPERPDPAPGADADPPAAGDAVRAALRELPPRMRAVVVLRHWLDLGVDETAALLGCSTGTVKSQNARGTARLRELLDAPVSAAAASFVDPYLH